MALSNFPFPYDIGNLLTGAVRIVYSKITGGTPAVIPAAQENVTSGVSPYSVGTGWTDLGATRENFTYSRGFDTEGLEIQQVPGNILEEVTGITRTIAVSMAEFNPFGFALMENAPNVATIAAAAGRSAQKKVAFGSFSSVDRYRWGFISRKPKAAGVVIEPATGAPGSRGRFVTGVAYEAAAAADEVEMEQGKGELTASELTFNLFPAPGQPEGEEMGAWFIEEAGTMT